MAHFSILMTKADGALALGATRDYHDPVPAAALIVAPGDEVLWVCEDADRTLSFERSPFASGVRTIDARRLAPTPAETVAPLERGPREVFRYVVREGRAGAGAPAGAAHLIVEGGGEPASPSPGTRVTSLEDISITRDGRRADRPGKETDMAAHLFKVTPDIVNQKFDIEYWRGAGKEDLATGFPSLIVKPGDDVHWELQGQDGVLVLYFVQSQPPFEKGAVFYGRLKQPALGGTVVGAAAVKNAVNKYTLVFTSNGGALKDPIVADPHIIIDNTE